jgi:hypothetical protein
VEKVLTLEKDNTAGVFSELYEKREEKGESAKEVITEPTLESRAVACKEALVEYLTLSKGLNSVFVLDREKFIKSRLRPAGKALYEREKEFQRALLNDEEIGMSLFSETASVPSYEEVAREMCAKSVSPLPQIVLTLAVLVVAFVESFVSFNTVDASVLSSCGAGVIAFSTFLFSIGLFGSRSALDSIESTRVCEDDVSKRYNTKYNLARGTGITESLNNCISAEVRDTIKRLVDANEFQSLSSLDDSISYEALASYVKDRALCLRLSLEGGSGLIKRIESYAPYKLISARERLTVLQNYSKGNYDYSRIGSGESLFSHIDLVSDVVAVREGSR